MKTLILEDDVLTSIDLAEMVQALGHEVVGPYHSLEEAVAVARSDQPVDFALLDHSIGSASSDEVVISLAARGVPFAFVTGRSRDELPKGHRDARLLAKPFLPEHVRSLLQDVSAV